jgi:hypothetical protein
VVIGLALAVLTAELDTHLVPAVLVDSPHRTEAAGPLPAVAHCLRASRTGISYAEERLAQRRTAAVLA